MCRHLGQKELPSLYLRKCMYKNRFTEFMNVYHLDLLVKTILKIIFSKKRKKKKTLIISVQHFISTLTEIKFNQ